jgi:hypothetical protein
MCKLTLGYGIFKNKLTYEFLHWVFKKNIKTAIGFLHFYLPQQIAKAGLSIPLILFY